MIFHKKTSIVISDFFNFFLCTAPYQRLLFFILLLGRSPSSRVARIVFDASVFHFVLSVTFSIFNPTLSIPLLHSSHFHLVFCLPLRLSLYIVMSLPSWYRCICHSSWGVLAQVFSPCPSFLLLTSPYPFSPSPSPLSSGPPMSLLVLSHVHF